jgi:uncharacterized protein YjbI with pentapeptide repeats/serine/threonine protein kinase
MSNYPDFSSHGYEIKRQLGQNRLGGRFTYLATNTKTQQPVVIKQFQFAQAGASWGDYEAYESEITLLKQLESPNIPRYLDSFETPTGFCLVQDYKKAPSLAQPRHFTAEEIKQIAIAVLEILVYLQRQRPVVIHRDIKPENILVDRSRQLKVYLIDFGFARLGGGDVAASSVVKGTLGFMPPEQLFNRQLTKASDLYSLGMTLICLLTKTKSTEIGNLIDKDYRINFKPLMPKLSRQFIDWLSKMTAPNFKERYPNAFTALTALRPIEVVGKDPTEKLLIHLTNLRDSVSDAVLNIQQSIDDADAGIGPKALAYLKGLGVNGYTGATQSLKAKTPTLVIAAILIVAGVSINSYWQNRYVRQLLMTNECVGCNLEKANLEGVDLENANLTRANLNQANLKAAFLENANLDGANLSGANLTGAKLNNANLNTAFLENANLEGAHLNFAQLRQAFLKGGNLEGASLERTDLFSANLEGTNIEGAILFSANLERTNFKDANLKDANLESSTVGLEGANFREANLEGANLRGVELNNVKLTGANLRGAIMPDGIRYEGLRIRRYRSRY